MITYTVKKIPAKLAKDYIRKNHYSRTSHNGPSPCYGLYDAENLIGVLMFATPCSENVRKWFDGIPEHTIELHRLHIKDGTPKNTESWFISRCMKLLQNDKPEKKIVVSFSDSTEGHSGTIYAASNFIKTGTTGSCVFYRDKCGRLRHPRQNGVNITLKDAKSMGWTPEKRSAKIRWHYVLGSNKRETKKLRNYLMRKVGVM